MIWVALLPPGHDDIQVELLLTLPFTGPGMAEAVHHFILQQAIWFYTSGESSPLHA